jgi:hypothetical protein
MKRGMVGVAVFAVLACLPGLANAGHRGGGGGCATWEGPPCGYQYVTTYKREKQTVWVYQPVTVTEEREILECVNVPREVERQYQVLEQQITTRPEQRTVCWTEWQTRKEKVKVYKPVTVMQSREVVELYPVTRQVKQKVQEMEQVLTPTEVERVWTTFERVATPVVRDVVCYVPQMVSLPPSCCNPCGATICKMVATVRKENFTQWTCVPKQHRAKEKVTVCSWRPVEREVMVAVTTCERRVRNIQVPVCSMQESTEEITVQVPVQRSRVENIQVQVCNLVPRTVKQKVQVWETRQVPRKVKVQVVHCERVQKEVEVVIPVTTCVPVAAPVCDH